ncbi:hypothetical protein HNQ27_07490 [Pseudomonas sp. B11D7D]|nr:hypothetical protein [Pseudomonas sp. B11D7D]QNH07309.1 hypothetical protein HNQ27_07490 [Pseudomonas sp. B11D7D]
MTTTIEDRVILILKEQMTPAELEAMQEGEGPFSAFMNRWTPPKFAGRGFWEKLAELTGVTSASWRSAFARRQKPTPVMIEKIAKLWPKYAFWLATGITDATNGHVAPITALTFPERLYAEDIWAQSYFRLSIELNERLFQEAGVNLDDEKERFSAAERTRPMAHWQGGALVSTAYRLATSSEYGRLREIWAQREADRVATIGRIDGSNRPWVKRREEMEAAGLSSFPVIGSDPRTSHQSSWDLFFEPKADTK